MEVLCGVSNFVKTSLKIVKIEIMFSPYPIGENDTIFKKTDESYDILVSRNLSLLWFRISNFDSTMQSF